MQLIATGPRPRRALSLERLISQHPGERLRARAARGLVYQYSSGSTGRPKRVARTHGQCWAEAESYRASIGINAHDRLFCAVPAVPHLRHGQLLDHVRAHGRHAGDHGGPEPVRPQPRAGARACSSGIARRSSRACRSTSGCWPTPSRQPTCRPCAPASPPERRSPWRVPRLPERVRHRRAPALRIHRDRRDDHQPRPRSGGHVRVRRDARPGSRGRHRG